MKHQQNKPQNGLNKTKNEKTGFENPLNSNNQTRTNVDRSMNQEQIPSQDAFDGKQNGNHDRTSTVDPDIQGSMPDKKGIAGEGKNPNQTRDRQIDRDTKISLEKDRRKVA